MAHLKIILQGHSIILMKEYYLRWAIAGLFFIILIFSTVSS